MTETRVAHLRFPLISLLFAGVKEFGVAVVSSNVVEQVSLSKFGWFSTLIREVSFSFLQGNPVSPLKQKIKK